MKALEWDRKEQQYIEEFSKKRQKIEEKWQKADILPENNQKFEPEAWKPDFSKPRNGKALDQKPGI